MLKTLELSNFAIVDSLSIELSAGLNVLTGETGAGKSILIDALSLLIGGRADSTWIRHGSDKALIQGIFTEDRSASRTLKLTGRSTARLDGELVSISELTETMSSSVALHGQHASQVLMNPTEQRKLLDRLLSPKDKALLAEYQASFAEYQKIVKTLAELKSALRERARRIDIISFQVNEINDAKLKADELDELKEQLETQRYAERIVSASSKASAALSEAEPNALVMLSDALRDLEQAAKYSNTLNSLAADLRDALGSVDAISQELIGFLSDFETEPAELERLEDRMALIENLQRKYGDSIESILKFKEQAEAELQDLQDAESTIETLELDKETLAKKLNALATSLTKARQSVAEPLSKNISKELKPLGMENAVFEVQLEPLAELNPQGKDKITFLFSANLGEAPSALSNVASGGELSRVMLALNVVSGTDVPILAFDEVDAGIGGKTARAVGKLLKQLAKNHQILVVTHLPQVAAYADAHFYVEKQEQDGRTLTTVKKLELKEQELELARMLSGNISEASLANARELLSESK